MHPEGELWYAVGSADNTLKNKEKLVKKIENSACASNNSQFSILNSQFVNVRITSAEPHDLFGEIVL